MKKLNLFLYNLLVMVIINSSQVDSQDFFSFTDFNNTARVDSVIVESGWKLLQIDEPLQGSLYPDGELKLGKLPQGSVVLGKVTADKKKFEVEAKYLILDQRNWAMVPFTSGKVKVKGTASDPPSNILYSSAFSEKREAARKAQAEEQMKAETAQKAAAAARAEEAEAKELALAKAKEDSMLAAKALEEKKLKKGDWKKKKKKKSKSPDEVKPPVDTEDLFGINEPSPKKEEPDDEEKKPSPKEAPKPPPVVSKGKWDAQSPAPFFSVHYAPGSRSISDPDSFFRVETQPSIQANVSWLTSGNDPFVGSISAETRDWQETVSLRIGRRYAKEWKRLIMESDLGGIFEESPFAYIAQIDTGIVFLDSLRNMYVSGDSVQLVSTLVSSIGGFLTLTARGPLQSVVTADIVKTNYSATYRWKFSLEPQIPSPTKASLHLFFNYSGSSSRFDRREFRAWRRLPARSDTWEWSAGMRWYGFSIGGGQQSFYQSGWYSWAPFWQQTESGVHILAGVNGEQFCQALNLDGKFAQYLIRPFNIEFNKIWDHYERVDSRSSGFHDSSISTAIWSFQWNWNW